jgi:hypothetical protein
LSFGKRYKGPHATHLEGDARHTAEKMHRVSAEQEYRGATNTMKAYDQTWFEWLEFTKADGTGIHVTPYTKVYDTWSTCETDTKQKRIKQQETVSQLPKRTS